MKKVKTNEVKLMVSPKFALISQDWSRALRGAAKFLVPALAVLVADLSNTLPGWVDAKYVAIVLWALNTVWGIFLKWVEESTYVKE